jgi:hypothetical protein
MWRTLLFATAALGVGAVACAHAPPRAPVTPPPSSPSAPEPVAVAALPPSTWPQPLAAAMQGRGAPHAPSIALPRDARGRDRWLSFVGTSDVAVGAWRVTLGPDGDSQVEAVERWPVGVRVVGGLVDGGVAYVLLESVAALDQPAGLRGAWIDSGAHPSAFDASPMALADVHDVGDLAARVAHPPAVGSAERNSVALLATLRAASTSTAMLGRALAAEGADVATAWQSIFVQHVGHLEGGEGPNAMADRPLADHALTLVRAAIATQACGADSCEAWTDTGRAVVRFAIQGGRWVIRALIEDAPMGGVGAVGAEPAAARAPGVSVARVVEATSDTSGTESLLRARAREVKEVLGEAPLTAGGGTIGVGLTDMTPDAPVIAVREGAAARVFPVDAGSVRAEAIDARWEAAFADVDGDGRTDVVIHMSGKRPDASPVTWTQVFLAPAASVQATSVEPDLATSFATMDAADARAAAQVATALETGGVSRDDACRLLSAASTPAGFRRVAVPGARVLLFDQPGMPTWHPKVVSAAKVAPDDVRGLGSHCAELVCSPTRPYCFWTSGADSLHAWFSGQGAPRMLLGAADYQGE